jgi:hypothetical protein
MVKLALSAATADDENTIPQPVTVFSNVRSTAAAKTRAPVLGAGNPAAVVSAVEPFARSTDDDVERFALYYGQKRMNSAAKPSAALAGIAGLSAASAAACDDVNPLYTQRHFERLPLAGVMERFMI